MKLNIPDIQIPHEHQPTVMFALLVDCLAHVQVAQIQMIELAKKVDPDYNVEGQAKFWEEQTLKMRNEIKAHWFAQFGE